MTTTFDAAGELWRVTAAVRRYAFGLGVEPSKSPAEIGRDLGAILGDAHLPEVSRLSPECRLCGRDPSHAVHRGAAA